jgi:hypothetical protein
MSLSIGLLAVAAVAALVFVVYALWPRWPDAPPAADAPALPIVIGDVLFRIPPAAIRQKMQRHAGMQERIDLAYLWPTLAPSAPLYGSGHDPALAAAPRLFVTIATNPMGMTPAERLKSIYPRYFAEGQISAPAGLAGMSFRPDTPYRGEELYYDPAAPDRFLARCTGDSGAAPGSCLSERFIGSDTVTIRFPRTLLGEWRDVLNGIDTIIDRLQPVQP